LTNKGIEKSSKKLSFSLYKLSFFFYLIKVGGS